jgi:hypothetical protein
MALEGQEDREKEIYGMGMNFWSLSDKSASSGIHISFRLHAIVIKSHLLRKSYAAGPGISHAVPWAKLTSPSARNPTFCSTFWLD